MQRSQGQVAAVPLGAQQRLQQARVTALGLGSSWSSGLCSSASKPMLPARELEVPIVHVDVSFLALGLC